MAQDPHINPASGVWDDNYYANLNKGSSSGGSNNDIASLAAQQLQMYQKANEPAVASLQASIPEIQAKTAQQGQFLQKQVGNLDQRYKDLLASVTGARDTAVQNVSTNTSQELGRRGISAEGGLFGQTMNKATQPIYQSFAGDVSNLGNQQQSELDTLMNAIQGNTQGGIEQTRAVQNAIAQLQAGAGQSSVTGALQMYQQQQAQKQQDFANKLAQQELAMKETAAKQPSYQVVGEGSTIIGADGKPVYTAPKTYAPTDNSFKDLIELFRQQSGGGEPKPTTSNKGVNIYPGMPGLS